jgi:hypothetical protein
MIASFCFGMATNVPTFFTAPSLCTYQTFTTLFEACEAPFFQRETVLQVPGHTLLRENVKITPEEFVAEEDFHCGNRKRLNDNKINEDDKIICTSNVLDPPDEMAAPDKSICRGPLIFDPLPPIAVDEDVTLAAADDQAELMQWHYRLGHLSFQKLKQRALNGEIPQNVLKLKPPKCDGSLFGMMTKLPWHGKESALSHKIFIAAKPGEIASVDQTESTEVGFFAQLKGFLTKKRYRYCTFLWTTSPDCILCTSKLMTPPQIPCLPSKRLRSLQPSMVSASYTITVITDNLLTMPGSNFARPVANDSLSAE